MQGALVILAVLVAVGLLLFYADRRKPHRSHDEVSSAPADADGGSQPECCGLHAVCEKKYSAPADAAPVYYDDEELDVLSGRDPDSYTDAEVEMLRDVVLTLRPEDAWGWSRSIEQRGIALPAEIRDELIIMLN